ncbi:hypothetical protein MD484_g6323, partial [Candolleomyces efflorescens]
MGGSIDEKKVEEPVMIEKAGSLGSSSLPPRNTTPEIDPEAERKLVRKLDWILLPLFTAIYMCNFIDRTSIGNAKVAGLEADLGMEGFDFNIALTTFYVFYVIADIPSNLLLKQFGSTWLAFLVIGFGLVSLASAFLHNMGGLLASRVFLGLTEGGTLIFLVEGLITTIFGLVLLFIVPEDPSKSRVLNEAERKLAMARIDSDQIVKSQGQKEKTTLRLVLRSFNTITIACTLCFVLLNMSFQGISLFLPSVIRSQGSYSTVEVQLRTVPPYLASAAWVILNAWISAKLKKRFLPLLYNVLIVVVGYAVSVSTRNSQARYAACFLMIMGGSVGGPMVRSSSLHIELSG